MRRLIPILAVLCLLCACANTTYKTLYAVGHAVDSGYSAYLDLVVTGKLRTNGVPAISAKYNSFQIIYGEAVAVAQFNKNATPPTNVTVQAAQVLTAIAVEKGSK